MTISSTSRRTSLQTGNGVATSYPFTFKVQDSDDIAVYRTEDGVETLVNPNSYTVTLNANQNTSPGGSVLFDTAPTAAQDFIITTAADATQETDLQNQGGFNPVVLTEQFDKLTILVQQLVEQAKRTPTQPWALGTVAPLNPATTASNLLGFDSDGRIVPRAASDVALTTFHATWQAALELRMPYRLDGGGLVDVRDYDESTSSDTEALQAAIDALGGSGSVLISRDLLITAITITGNVRLFSWNNSTIKQAPATAADMFSVTGVAKVVYFHDLTLDQDCDNQAPLTPYAPIRVRAAGSSTPSRLIGERLTILNPGEQGIAYYGDNTDNTDKQLILRDIKFYGGTQGSDVPTPKYAPVNILLARAPGVHIDNVFSDLGATPVLGRGLLWNQQIETATAHFATFYVNNVRGYRMGCTANGAPACMDFYWWAKASVVTHCELVDNHGAGFRTKNNSKAVVFAFNTVDGISAGVRPFSLVSSDATQGDDYLIGWNVARGASGAPSIDITAENSSHAFSSGVHVIGNKVSGHDDIGIRIDVSANVTSANNEVRGGTIPYYFTQCQGSNSSNGDRATDGSSTYGMYIDNSASGDWVINHPKIYCGSTSAIYASCRRFNVNAPDTTSPACGILTGVCASVTISGGELGGLSTGDKGISIGGNVSGNVTITGVTTSAALPLEIVGTVSGVVTNDANSWNTSSALPAWAAPNGTKSWNRAAVSGQPLGWLRSAGAWIAMPNMP